MSGAEGVIVIGGGPAGLMAAEVLSRAGIAVDLYDAMPSVGRKFLMAGKGGLNITHSEPSERFLARYGQRQKNIAPLLADFGADALQTWVHDLGITTFVGSSGRVFPAEMKAAPLLRAWLRRLKQAGVRFHMRHRWTGWDDGAVAFDTPDGLVRSQAKTVILALGGGSWPQLGSDGLWAPVLRTAGVEVSSLRSANCGFDATWSEYFRTRFAGTPVKSVAAQMAGGRFQRGEFVVSTTGIEGGLVYAASAHLRDEIEDKGRAIFALDLNPAKNETALLQELARPRGKNSLANYLRKYAGLDGVKAGLLREVLAPKDFDDPKALTAAIKALPLPLTAPRPLIEAISTAGGVRFESLNEHLMLLGKPGVFCAGEMLDWEAPTGGYLLTACFASGKAAGEGALSWLRAA